VFLSETKFFIFEPCRDVRVEALFFNGRSIIKIKIFTSFNKLQFVYHKKRNRDIFVRVEVSMKRIFKYQRATILLSAFTSGMNQINRLLDPVNNSSSVPSLLVDILIICVVIYWISIELILRKHSIKWLKENQSFSIKKLGITCRLELLGALLILAIPRVISFYQAPPKMIEHNNQARLEKDATEYLQLRNCFLRPFPSFFSPDSKGFYEAAELNFNVINYSNQPVILTAMDIEIIGGALTLFSRFQPFITSKNLIKSFIVKSAT
jgi:hypothetical protein